MPVGGKLLLKGERILGSDSGAVTWLLVSELLLPAVHEPTLVHCCLRQPGISHDMSSAHGMYRWGPIERRGKKEEKEETQPGRHRPAPSCGL